MKILCGPVRAGGERKFTHRLIKAFGELGHEITYDPEDEHEIHFGVRTFGFKSDKPNVLRLDGLYYNLKRENHQEWNREIFRSYSKADAIVFQSKFGKVAVEEIFGDTHQQYAVIHNGADPKFYAEADPIKTNFRFNAVCSAKWRGVKRLDDIIKSFLAWNLSGVGLWIIGEPRYRIKSTKLRYVGSVDNDGLIARYLRMADVFIHLGYLDICPNSVVEALVAGCPVVCNNQGGTPEIVRNSGIICDIDAEYNWNNLYIQNPPRINRATVTNAIMEIYHHREKYRVRREDLDIRNVAVKYVDFFREVIGG